MTCARCGRRVCRAEDQIIMSKMWHKSCFRCGNCDCLLNERSARLFRGDIFCDRCHDMIFENNLHKTCSVVSSPSCICIKKENVPTFNYCPKYDRIKDCHPKTIKSCSCLPDRDKEKSYCFAFPIPREVANYYNRINMRRKSRQRTPKYTSGEERCPRRVEMSPYITIRSVSPSKKRRSSKSREIHPVTCCCRRSPPKNHCRPNNIFPCPRGGCNCCYRRGCSPIRRYSPSRKEPPQHCPRCCGGGSPRRTPSSDPDIADYSDRHSHSFDCCECFCPDRTEKVAVRHCVCGKSYPCDCKISRIRDECTSLCVRCNRKVYAAEKICISSGPFHTSCFSCYCCHKLLDVKNVYEHKGEIYCRNCYNTFMGNQYYGYGASQCY